MTTRPMYLPDEQDFVDRYIQGENPLERRERDSLIYRFIDQPLEPEPVKKSWLRRIRLWPRKKKAPVVTEDISSEQGFEPAYKHANPHRQDRVAHNYEYGSIGVERSTPTNSIENKRQPPSPRPQLRRQPDFPPPTVPKQPSPRAERNAYPASTEARPRRPPQSSRGQATKTPVEVRFVPSKPTESVGSSLDAAPIPRPATFAAQPSKPYSPRASPIPASTPSSSPPPSTNPSLFDHAGSSTPPTSNSSQDDCRDHVPIKLASSGVGARVPAPIPTFSPAPPTPITPPTRSQEKRLGRKAPPPVPPLVYDPIPTIAELEAGVGFETGGKAIVVTLQQLAAGERNRTELVKQDIAYNRAWTEEIRAQTAEYRELADQISRRRGNLGIRTPSA